MSKGKPSKAQRLEALRELLEEIACGIRNAQEGLLESENPGTTVSLVVDTLGRLGWMADQGCVIAGQPAAPVVGGAHAWLRTPEFLARLKRRAPR
jgi:hypothetical protein